MQAMEGLSQDPTQYELAGISSCVPEFFDGVAADAWSILAKYVWPASASRLTPNELECVW